MKISFDSTVTNNNIPIIISSWNTHLEENYLIKLVGSIVIKQEGVCVCSDRKCLLEPDVGMPEYLAQHYFKQVVAGMVSTINQTHKASTEHIFHFRLIYIVWV